MQHCAEHCTSTGVSEEHVASISKVQEYAKQEISMKYLASKVLLAT
jgi:hypothetical protein